MKPHPPVQIRKFNFSKDIIIRLSVENGRLKKELAERDRMIAEHIKKAESVERALKGALGSLWGEKPVKESERAIVKVSQS